jgi:hypothetical protein
MDEKAAENRFFFLLKLQAFFFLAGLAEPGAQQASELAGRRVGGGCKGRDSARAGRFGRRRCAAGAMKLLQLLVDWVRFAKNSAFLLKIGAILRRRRGEFSFPGDLAHSEVRGADIRPERLRNANVGSNSPSSRSPKATDPSTGSGQARVYR